MDFDYTNIWEVCERGNVFINNLGNEFEVLTAKEFQDAQVYVINNSISKMPDENKIIVRLSDEL